MKKSRLLWSLLVVVVAVGVYVGSVLATPAVNQTTSTIAKSTFDPFKVKVHTDPASIWRTSLKTHGQSDVYVVDNKFSAVVHQASGDVVASTGWHSHPGPSLIFVLSGTVTNYTSEDKECAGHKYAAGQGFIDTGKDVHNLRNEGDVPAETVAVQLLPAGTASRRIDQPSPGNCPF
jgi:quercetin dioxygenase-like cupin family protein